MAKKLNRFLAKVWASRHEIYLIAIFTHLVLKLCNNKNLRYWFKFVSHFNLWTKFNSIRYIRNEQKVVVLQLHNWKLPPLAHFPIIFALFWKTYDLLKSFFKCGSRVVHNFLTKQWCKALKGAGPSPGFHSRGCHIFKYNIGCMLQSGGKTWNGHHRPPPCLQALQIWIFSH